MNLEELIDALSNEDQNKTIKLGFSNPHSYRGYYCDLAFVPTESVTIGSMLKCAKLALGSTFPGWKGGDYTMSEYTTVWLSNVGETGEAIGRRLLAYMLSDEV